MDVSVASDAIPSLRPTAEKIRELAWCGAKRSTSSADAPASARAAEAQSVISRTASVNSPRPSVIDMRVSSIAMSLAKGRSLPPAGMPTRP